MNTHVPDEFFKNYGSYIADTQAKLDQQPVGAFNPNLGLLDAMISSLKIDK